MRCLISLFAIVFLFSPAVSEAAVTPHMKSTWERYASPADRLVLEGMAMQQMPPELATASPAEKLAAMRAGFEMFAVALAPAVAAVKQEPYQKGEVSGIRFVPQKADAQRVILYFHGGGYVAGSVATAAAQASYLAEQANMVCLSLNYPLAPEAPYPAATDNALKAYTQLLDDGIKPEHIVLSGDSAGGGLALATLVQIRDRGLPAPAGAYLLSPWADLTNSTPTHELKKAEDPMLDKGMLEEMAHLYAGANDRKNPFISPAYADVRGLPPLLIHVGSHEVLLDDSLTIARNAALADVPVQLEVMAGYPHVFQMLHGSLEAGRTALQKAALFLRDVTGAMPAA